MRISDLQGEYPEKPRIVHRLDRTTSGLLLLARTRKAAQELATRFHDGTAGATDNTMDGGGDYAGRSITKKVAPLVYTCVLFFFFFFWQVLFLFPRVLLRNYV